MNIGWLKIIGATLFELVWVTGLKYAELPWQWGVTALSILGSSYCLITAGNTLPVGTAYSVFVGLSAIGTILVEFLGTDLSKINNELEKLKIILPKGHTFTPKDIEENIGFSKDYNNFELRKAIGEKDQFKAYKIIDHFSQNPKDNPLVVTTGLVFGFFSQLLQYHGLKDKSQFNAAKVLKVSPYFVKDYEVAFRNYPMKKVSAIVAALRDIDVKSKGVGASSMSQHDLLKEMLIKIFN